MILLYTSYLTSRLQYTANFLFSTILGVPVEFTSSINDYKKSILPKINYSAELLDGITIQPHTFLFERNIKPIIPGFLMYHGIPTLFPIKQPSSLPFDPFSAVFYMISRYEEYHPEFIDHHNRVLPQQSVAFKHQFMEISVVDRWAFMLRELIQQQYPHFHFPDRKYTFVPTIDIDVAYAYKYRGFVRTAGATLKSLVKGDVKDNQRRYQTLFKNQADPFDVYKLLQDLHSHYNVKPHYFFLVGRYGKFDKNLSPSHSAIQQLIKQTSDVHAVGIHPSYQSNDKENRLKQEIEVLGKITGNPIVRSRQHFLMLRFPDTYQRLVKLGITDDYTMGYAQLTGFRAGTCTPFPFYDLTSESETSLIVHPFEVMDGTLNQYLKLSPLEAIECINRLSREVRNVNGTFMSLWHNESLSEMRHWKNWREVYEALLKIAS